MGRMVCAECFAVADERAKGWCAYRGHLTGEDVEPIVFYCPTCDRREFGGLVSDADDQQAAITHFIRTLRNAVDRASEAER
jgi:hypothetical protein